MGGVLNAAMALGQCTKIVKVKILLNFFGLLVKTCKLPDYCDFFPNSELSKDS